MFGLQLYFQNRWDQSSSVLPNGQIVRLIMLSCRNLLSPTKVSPEKKRTRYEAQDERGDIDEFTDLTKSPGGDQEQSESTGSQWSRTSMSSSGRPGGVFGADGSPVFQQKSLPFTEAATGSELGQRNRAFLAQLTWLQLLPFWLQVRVSQ